MAVAKAQKERDYLLKYLKKIPEITNNFIPNVELPRVSSDDLEQSLEVLKAELLTKRCGGTKKHTLSHCAVSILYQVVSLVLEDINLARSLSNIKVYLKPVVLAVTTVTPAKQKDNMVDGLDHANRARSSLKFRKRNLNNNPETEDRLAQLNFLNRLDQLDRELQILRDLVLIEMTQSSSMRDRMRKWRRHMMEVTMNDLTRSDSSSCCSDLDPEDTLNETLGNLAIRASGRSVNNNSDSIDEQKEKEKSPEEDEELPELLFYDNQIM